MKLGTLKRKVASFDVDAQKGFTSVCPNELPVKDGEKIVDELNAQAKLAELRVGSKDCHPSNALWLTDKDHPIFSPVKNGGPNVDLHWPAHCLVGTKGNELIDGLPKVSEYDFMVSKGIEPDLHPYGACYHDLGNKISTGVIEFLKDNEVTDVVVGGLAIDYCLGTTAIQLALAGFKVYVNLAASRGITEESSKKKIEEMKTYGINIFLNAQDIAVNIFKRTV
jgi:nicotinamidase/pyrazinamidase